MASIASAWPLAARALTIGMRARAGYRSPTTDAAGVPVYYLGETSLSSESVPKLLVIGWIGEPDTIATDPGSAGQAVSTIGTARHREETGTIACRVVVHQGEAQLSGADPATAGTMGDALAQAFAVLDDLDAFLRGSGDLGLMASPGPMQSLEAWITGVPSINPWLNEGSICRLTATVTYRARI